MTDRFSGLDDKLQEALETQTGARIVKVVSRGGGGASRQGAELTFAYPDGSEKRGYLSFDTRVSDSRRAGPFQRETAILKALSGPLNGKGIKAPGFLAAVPERLAMVTEFVTGSDKFQDVAAPEAVAADFMAQLSRLHAVDPKSVELAGFGAPNETRSQRIREKLDELRGLNERTIHDPVFVLALNWLERNVPEDRGAEVIVHGDAGVGNFLHDKGRVTALLDWELTHFGDPMEDLAQIWVRSLFQPFRPMAELFAAYETAGGERVDLAAVKFHRLYFQMGFTLPGQVNLATENDVEVALFGISLMFNQAHMRVIVKSLGELMNIALEAPKISEIPTTAADRAYRVALDDLRNDIVPNVTGQHAAAKAKSLARMVKYWRERERYGATFEAAECSEIEALLSQSVATVEDGRKALSQALESRSVSQAEVLQLCYNRVMRNNHMLAGTMGRLADTYFPPLDGT